MVSEEAKVLNKSLRSNFCFMIDMHDKTEIRVARKQPHFKNRP